ncbi:MAG: hypothetical protein ABSD62_14775 [Candidatus Limnocylindrales bacterium]|jgi:hypothetical protein
MDERYRADLTKIAASMARRGTTFNGATTPEDLPLFRTYYRHLAELTGLVRVEPELSRKDSEPEPQAVT